MVGTDLVLEAYKLGPNHMVVGGQQLELYEIPPALPPIGQWTVANARSPTRKTASSTASRSRMACRSWRTAHRIRARSNESGPYQIKLDLYDAAGNHIDIAAKSIDYYVPDDVDLTPARSTPSRPTRSRSPGGGTLVDGNSLILTLHVDNNHCWAGIGAPSTPTGSGGSVLRRRALQRW